MNEEFTINDNLPTSGTKYHGRKVFYGIIDRKIHTDFLFKLEELKLTKQEIIALVVEGILNEDPDFMKYMRKKIPVKIKSKITSKVKKDMKAAETIEETIDNINKQEIEEIYDFLEAEVDEL